MLICQNPRTERTSLSANLAETKPPTAHRSPLTAINLNKIILPTLRSAGRITNFFLTFELMRVTVVTRDCIVLTKIEIVYTERTKKMIILFLFIFYFGCKDREKIQNSKAFLQKLSGKRRD